MSVRVLRVILFLFLLSCMGLVQFINQDLEESCLPGAAFTLVSLTTKSAHFLHNEIS